MFLIIEKAILAQKEEKIELNCALITTKNNNTAKNLPLVLC